MLDVSGQIPEVRRKPTTGVSAVSRVRGVEGAGESGSATLEARAPAALGPVYTFAQNMGLIQNRTLLIMQSQQIQRVTRQSDLFEREEVRKKFSNALIMVAAHSPEELEIFLLTTQRMAQGGNSERLAMFFDQVTQALTDRIKKRPGEEDDEFAEEAFPIPHDEDDDLVAQVRVTLEKRFLKAKERAAALGVVPGEQPSDTLKPILESGKRLIEETEPVPEVVLDLLVHRD